MESLYDRYKIPLPQPSSMDYGAYLREMRQKQQQQLLQQQQMQQQLGGDRIPSRLSQRGDMLGTHTHTHTLDNYNLNYRTKARTEYTEPISKRIKS